MAQATVVRYWRDDTTTYLAVRVAETVGVGDDRHTEDTEYIGQLPNAALTELTEPEQRAAMLAAAKAVRDSHFPVAVDLGGSGAAVHI